MGHSVCHDLQTHVLQSQIDYKTPSLAVWLSQDEHWACVITLGRFNVTFVQHLLDECLKSGQQMPRCAVNPIQDWLAAEVILILFDALERAPRAFAVAVAVTLLREPSKCLILVWVKAYTGLDTTVGKFSRGSL